MARKSGIVNVRMVITEEKILSNIDKVQKLINPNSKKQIVQLDEDTYFKDLIESIKTYLIEYPKKKNFPVSVYKAAYGLVEYSTNQFEENTKQIEELIRQRETNISLAGELKEIFECVDNKDKNWKDVIKKAEDKFQEDIIETLGIIGRSKSKTSQNYLDATKLINARISNLESNLHIEIDMERIEDRSKALSYIGIEVADALKAIPTPVEEEQVDIIDEILEEASTAKANVNSILETENNEVADEVKDTYLQETQFEVKPSLWQRFKNSKLVRAIKFVTNIRIRLEVPSNALPEGRGE